MQSSSRHKYKCSKEGSSSRSSSQAQAFGQGEPPRNKKHKSTTRATTTAAVAISAEPKFFTVEKIVGTKIVNGVKLYKTRWEGYTPNDDTWEPWDHVASTGHVDRYERKQRELTLSTYTPGVAVVEYDDGERQTIDLLQEKFRSWMDGSDDERDDDSLNGDDDVNNFDLIHGGAMIELLWPHAQIYFSCKVISWTPISDVEDKNDKKTVMRHGSLLWKMKERVEADEKRQFDITPTTTPPPVLAEGAAAGCKHCEREPKTGIQTRKEHGDNCPRKCSSASSSKPKELDVKQNSVVLQNGGENIVTTGKGNDAPGKKESRKPCHEKERSASVTKYKSSDAPIDKHRLDGGEKKSAEMAMSKVEAKNNCEVDPTTGGAAAGYKKCVRELKQQSYGKGNAEAEGFASMAITVSASGADDDDARVEEEILQGLLSAQNHKEAKWRKNIQVSTKIRDELLEESFPKIHHTDKDDGQPKELTMDDYLGLRTGLQDVIQSDVKEKMTLLREQLSDYHLVLEDVIAFQSRCERLEQEKQDLASFCREACQIRDDKIALLEKELAELRNDTENEQFSSFDGASPGMSDHNHHYFIGSDNGDAPVSLPHPNPRRSDDNNSDGLRDIEGSMWEPLPFRFQKSSPSMFAEMNQQLQESFDFDDIFHSCSRISSEGDGRSTKRQRPS